MDGIKSRQWVDEQPAYQKAHEVRAKERSLGGGMRLLVDGTQKKAPLRIEDTRANGGEVGLGVLTMVDSKDESDAIAISTAGLSSGSGTRATTGSRRQAAQAVAEKEFHMTTAQRSANDVIPGTSIVHPDVDRLRSLLKQRKTKFPLPKGLVYVAGTCTKTMLCYHLH